MSGCTFSGNSSLIHLADSQQFAPTETPSIGETSMASATRMAWILSEGRTEMKRDLLLKYPEIESWLFRNAVEDCLMLLGYTLAIHF